MQNLLKSIISHEGFSSRPYPDPITKGVPFTFGHGLTYLTEGESIEIVKNRIVTIRSQISTFYPPFSNFPDEVKDIITEMAYQMGVTGLLQFKDTLHHILNKDYVQASKNMLASKWAKQTPKRAQTLANKMAQIKG